MQCDKSVEVGNNHQKFFINATYLKLAQLTCGTRLSGVSRVSETYWIYNEKDG